MNTDTARDNQSPSWPRPEQKVEIRLSGAYFEHYSSSLAFDLLKTPFLILTDQKRFIHQMQQLTANEQIALSSSSNDINYTAITTIVHEQAEK